MNTKLFYLTGELGTPEFQAAYNELVGIAQRQGHIKVTQASAPTFPAGTLVAIDGYDATLGCPIVVKADASTPLPASLVLSENLATGGVGIAYVAGVVGALDTSGAAAVGAPAYLTTAGGIAWSAPATPGHVVQIVGRVKVKSSTVGEVLFFLEPATLIADVVAGGLVGTAALTHVRGGKITLNGVGPTRVLFTDPDAATILGTDNAATKNMGNGKTLIVNPDAGGDDTVTFAATAGTSASGASPSTDIHLESDSKFKISVDGDTAEEVTLTLDGLTSGAAIATEMQTKVQALGANKAAVTVAYTTVYTITSGRLGTGSRVVITPGATGSITEELKIGVAGGGTEAVGTGDFANAAAATAAEIAAALAARATGWTATAEGNKVRITSATTGLDSSLVVNAASTADTVIGVSGAAYGAQGLGCDTDMASDDYLVQATLNGVAQANLAAKCLAVTSRTASGFQVECETAAATHDVDLVVLGIPA